MATTDEYLLKSFQSRTESIEAIFKAIDAGDEIDSEGNERDPSEELAEYALSMDTTIHVAIVISTGGPHEEIDCEVSKASSGYGYELDRATFGAYWGGERRETTLHEGDALWRYAEYMLEGWEPSA